MARTQDEDQEETLAEGTLLSHLVELRTRLFWMFGAVFLIFLALLPFSKMIFNYVAAPLVSVVPNGELLALSPVSPLTATIALTFYIALFIAMPVILYQAWAFIAPGLYRKEKRFAFPLFATSVVLFFVGMAFAYYVVFPLIFGFVSTFTPDTVNYQPDMTEYVSFVMMVVLVFGLAFETPIATVLLVITGLTTTEKLGKARPYVFLGAFVIGMLLTPPDVISQTMLAVPVYLLYEMGILMSRIVRPSGNDVAEDASNGV
ncbi:MAG: twin-arginine translocase subunit TatC [Woeseiaceae bacterium]|jgi:sec-independent protein translocase protein TatC